MTHLPWTESQLKKFYEQTRQTWPDWSTWRWRFVRKVLLDSRPEGDSGWKLLGASLGGILRITRLNRHRISLPEKDRDFGKLLGLIGFLKEPMAQIEQELEQVWKQRQTQAPVHRLACLNGRWVVVSVAREGWDLRLERVAPVPPEIYLRSLNWTTLYLKALSLLEPTHGQSS